MARTWIWKSINVDSVLIPPPRYLSSYAYSNSFHGACGSKYFCFLYIFCRVYGVLKPAIYYRRLPPISTKLLCIPCLCFLPINNDGFSNPIHPNKLSASPYYLWPPPIALGIYTQRKMYIVKINGIAWESMVSLILINKRKMTKKKNNKDHFCLSLPYAQFYREGED